MVDNYINKKTISICIPVRNESENIQLIYNEIKKIFYDKLNNYKYEIIFTDNLSTDKSFEIIKASQVQTIKLRVINFLKI